MKLSLLILLAIGVAIQAQAPPVPTFPADWSGYTTNQLIQNQGSFIGPNGALCCNEGTNCQVQIQFSAGQSYTDHAGNRTRDDQAPGQAIITLFSDQKEYLVINGKCDSFCPLQGDTMSPGAGIIGDNATYTGKMALPNGTMVDTFTWKEIAFGIITMETSVLYLDLSTNPASPIQEIDDITPFGQHVGTSTGTYGPITWGTPDPKIFAFTGKDSCPQNSNCGQNSFQQSRQVGKRWKTWAKARQGEL